MAKVNIMQFPIGADPEFFFTRAGRIVGAERVLPKAGLKTRDGLDSKVIIDGVQAELNPIPSICRANFGNHIKACFVTLRKELEAREGRALGISTSQMVQVSQKELDRLTDENKKFGCDPSLNTYKEKGPSVQIEDMNKFKPRMAGGHLHFGKPKSVWVGNDSIVEALSDPARTVPILDLLLGNTCVLIDKGTGPAKRRKYYGRAGEYRMPEHGIEYRTLSNFWLHSYQLTSFVTGMGRAAVNIVASSIRNGANYDKILSEFVSKAKVQKAINNNDFNLAWNNYQKIKNYYLELVAGNMGNLPINTSNHSLFEHFITKPIEYWFPADPLTHWCEMPEGHGSGWESWAEQKLRPDMEKAGKEERV